MDACEEYARRWAKKEDVEVDTLSEWVKSIADVLKRRIRRLKRSVNTRHESIFCDPEVVRELSRLHENFVIVPADKASNNYTFVCKKYYVSILIEELGLNSLPGNPTYNLTDFSASEVLDNHKSVLTSFGIDPNEDELDLPYIYWIPKMHKNPYKHRFIAGSARCSTKPLSILLTKLLTHIKQGLQKYCETAYSRSGVNQMWILKNSKELLEHLKSPNFNNITSIKSFDFSTLYTTIPHDKLKSRLASIIRNSFMFKNGNRRYKYLVLGHEESYFVKEHSDSKHKYSEDDIIKMLELLVDNIFVVFAGKVFKADSRYSNGNKLCPSSSRHISLLVWSGIYTVFALNRVETVGVSVQFHIQVHRWCFVHKQPRIWELPGPDVSRWTRDQRHDREQHFCFLPGFTSVDREGRSTSHFHLWQTWRFQFPHHKLSVPE